MDEKKTLKRAMKEKREEVPDEVQAEEVKEDRNAEGSDESKGSTSKDGEVLAKNDAMETIKRTHKGLKEGMKEEQVRE